jgi:hypothetical protein
MAQAVSRRPLTAEARYAPGSVHVWFVVDKVALGHVSLRVIRVSPVSIIPPWLPNLIDHLRDEQQAVRYRSSETKSHPIDMNTHIHIYTHTCTHTYMHACMHTYIHTRNQMEASMKCLLNIWNTSQSNYAHVSVNTAMLQNRSQRAVTHNRQQSNVVEDGRSWCNWEHRDNLLVP